MIYVLYHYIFTVEDKLLSLQRLLSSLVQVVSPGGSSPIGLSVLRDIESNMCCTKISSLDYFFEKSQL